MPRGVFVILQESSLNEWEIAPQSPSSFFGSWSWASRETARSRLEFYSRRHNQPSETRHCFSGQSGIEPKTKGASYYDERVLEWVERLGWVFLLLSFPTDSNIFREMGNFKDDFFQSIKLQGGERLYVYRIRNMVYCTVYVLYSIYCTVYVFHMDSVWKTYNRKNVSVKINIIMQIIRRIVLLGYFNNV